MALINDLVYSFERSLPTLFKILRPLTLGFRVRGLGSSRWPLGVYLQASLFGGFLVL